MSKVELTPPTHSLSTSQENYTGYVTLFTPHIYVNKGIKIQILIKSIFKTFLNTSLSNG